MPEAAVLFCKVHFCIGDGGQTVGTPVDDPLTPVDQSLFIETDKHFIDGLVAALVQRKPLPFPITGGTELF